MCFQASNIITTTRKRWEGDEIQHSPIVRSKRYIPGTEQQYPIDIREFLLNSSNAVVTRAWHQAIARLDSAADREAVRTHELGSFDLRVRAVCDYLAHSVKYEPRRAHERGIDQWLFPDETLENRGGDCEDHAFLLAALILASGVSGYMVRVALGRLVNHRTGKAIDHAWVVYKAELGNWIILDPLIYTRDGKRQRGGSPKQLPGKRRVKSAGKREAEHSVDDIYEYMPRFVFNDAHLWSIHDHKHEHRGLEHYVGTRKFWKEFDPSFAASVHNSIFDAALGTMSWVNRQFVKAVSLGVDANIVTYDPRDHFDNGYIDDGWVLVQGRLRTKRLDDFALACHAIGDFYAHSSWGVFGERVKGKLQPYDDVQPRFQSLPDYSAAGPFPLTDAARFSVNERVWKGTRAQAADTWRGKIISGRYAQNSDPHQGFFEKLTYIPSSLRNRADYYNRTGLPHHNEIACDSLPKDAAHHLYPTPAAFEKAHRERVDAAVAHVKKVYAAWGG